MRNERFYYQSTIPDFLKTDNEKLLGLINGCDDFSTTQLTQRDSWQEEIIILKNLLSSYDKGTIIFEYTIPRLGKRIDTVLLLNGLIFVLEFKINADCFLRQDIDQVWDYALDLKNFHEESHDKIIIPILIATEVKDSNTSISINPSFYDDMVYEPACVNTNSLSRIITSVLSKHNFQAFDVNRWINSRYSPTPTIIEAASYLFNNHSVENITRCDATGKSLDETTETLLKIIAQTKENHEKAICFVTGVPGAGKTLVGLKVAISQFTKNEKDKTDLAVYLSGNGPLVDVLSEALARDKKRKDDLADPNNKHPISVARREVKSFIQIVHHYRNNSLAKIKIENGKICIDERKVVLHKDDGYSEVDHVAIFDEAQRAWTKDQLAGWLSRKKGIKDFPQSEPEFLIWSLNLRPDWAVMICLVGGGQEINTGEAGISEWIKAINKSFPDWKVYISQNLTEKEYAEGNTADYISKNKNVIINDKLHLAVSMRSFRTEKLSLFVHNLLERNLEKSQELYNQLKDNYPIAITRSLDTAKRWLKKKARGSERYGIVVSSQAYRLRPLSIDVRAKPDTIHWFLDDEDDIRSSLFLEDVATEFDVQGLELDWTCLVWDGDFRYSNKGWQNYSFTGGKWQNINSEQRKKYQLNAYRVLLTRARQGMIIVIPEGKDKKNEVDKEFYDPTRDKSFYDPTYNYLKSIGFEEI